jgi:hypothetical protein
LDLHYKEYFGKNQQEKKNIYSKGLTRERKCGKIFMLRILCANLRYLNKNLTSICQIPAHEPEKAQGTELVQAKAPEKIRYFLTSTRVGCRLALLVFKK